MTSQKLRGFVGQSMAGRKSHRDAMPWPATQPVVATSGTGTVTANRPCTAVIIAWGAGASGATSAGTTGGTGGGAGAALYKRVRLSRGQSLSYSVGAGGAAPTPDAAGNDGGDTTVTLPNGVVLTAGGGKAGAAGDGAGGAGGVATGGDVNRNGGRGGARVSNLGAAGETPQYGAAGGAATVNNGGGGGAAGFADVASDFIGGAGSAASVATPPGAPGGGSGASSGGTIGAGGAGRVCVMLVYNR